MDIHEALHESREVLKMWLETQKHPDVPAFSGGLLDVWPAFAVDGLAICRTEVQRIRAYVREVKS